MSYLVAKQPNKNYAIYSTVCSDFIYIDESREGVAFILEREYNIAPEIAQDKIADAEYDIIPFTQNKGDGNTRWNALIENSTFKGRKAWAY